MDTDMNWKSSLTKSKNSSVPFSMIGIHVY